MKKIDELKAELEIASNAHHEKLMSLPNNLSFNEFQKKLEKTSNKVADLDRQIRFLKEPEFTELSKHDHKMSLVEFIVNVKDGSFIDYDGFGTYIKDDKDTGIVVYPSDVENNSIRKEFTEIVWYNR